VSLSDLASIGSFVSALAVVVTLAFLLIQTRQTNRNQQSLMQQARTERTVGLRLNQTEPPPDKGHLIIPTIGGEETGGLAPSFLFQRRLTPSLMTEYNDVVFNGNAEWRQGN
jgi:hypothetical protein